MDTIVFDLYQNPLEQVRIINEKAKEASKQIKKALIEDLLEVEIEDYLPLKYAKKRRARLTPFLCPHCGQRKADKIQRNGHYKMGLKVSKREITNLRVRMLECKVCGRKINLRFRVLDPKTLLEGHRQGGSYPPNISSESYQKIKRI